MKNRTDKLAVMIGNRIREARKAKGLRQEDMKSLGISYKYFQTVENGRVNPTLKTIQKIADALGIEATELFYLPLGKSTHVNELAEKAGEIIRNNDEQMAKKLNLLIKELLR